MNEKKYKYDLEERTKKFALNIIDFIRDIPYLGYCRILIDQLLKSGTSIGANYREANRAESKRDFIHKIGIVLKEASETQYWLELFIESNIGDKEKATYLHQEATELLAIFTTISKNSKRV